MGILELEHTVSEMKNLYDGLYRRLTQDSLETEWRRESQRERRRKKTRKVLSQKRWHTNTSNAPGNVEQDLKRDTPTREWMEPPVGGRCLIKFFLLKKKSGSRIHFVSCTLQKHWIVLSWSACPELEVNRHGSPGRLKGAECPRWEATVYTGSVLLWVKLKG